MPVTRRDSLRLLGAVPLIAAASKAAAAPPSPAPVPIVTSGGTRLYPDVDTVQWWTPQTIRNGTWTLPQVLPANENPVGYVPGGFPTMGAWITRDGATSVQDIRNVPLHGAFTRLYQQLVTRPLAGDQLLEGTVSLAIHAVQNHRRLNTTLAIQVVVHAPDRTARGFARAVTAGGDPFTVGAPARTRAIVNLPLTPVSCQDGDVIAINIGISANNETRSLGHGIGLAFYAHRPNDIAVLDTDALGNTWVEFSTPLAFQP